MPTPVLSCEDLLAIGGQFANRSSEGRPVALPSEGPNVCSNFPRRFGVLDFEGPHGTGPALASPPHIAGSLSTQAISWRAVRPCSDNSGGARRAVASCGTADRSPPSWRAGGGRGQSTRVAASGWHRPGSRVCEGRRPTLTSCRRAVAPGQSFPCVYVPATSRAPSAWTPREGRDIIKMLGAIYRRRQAAR